MKLSDFAALFDQLESLLAQLVAKEECCGPGGSTGFDNIIDDLLGDNPPVGFEEDFTGSDVVVGTGDPPSDIVDWSEYDLYLCGAAKKFYDGLVVGFDLTHDVFVGLATLAAGALWYYIAAFIPVIGLPIAIIGALITLVDLISRYGVIESLIVDETTWETARTALINGENEIVCAIYESTTAEDAYTALDTVLSGLNSYLRDNLLGIYPIRSSLRRIFNGDSTASPSSDCNCEEQYDFAIAWGVDWAGNDALDPPGSFLVGWATLNGGEITDAATFRANGNGEAMQINARSLDTALGYPIDTHRFWVKKCFIRTYGDGACGTHHFDFATTHSGPDHFDPSGTGSNLTLDNLPEEYEEVSDNFRLIAHMTADCNYLRINRVEFYGYMQVR